MLQSRPKLRADIIDSALAQLPFVGQQIADDPSKLNGNTVVLVLGLAAALWGGMKAFVAVHTALDDIGEQPLDERANLLITRLRALLGMAYVGGAQVATAILTSLASVTGVRVISKVLLLIFTTAINIGVLALSYRWLRTSWPSWRSVLPGAIVGGVLFARAAARRGRDRRSGDRQRIARLRHLRIRHRIAVVAEPARDHRSRRSRAERGPRTDRPPRPPDCD